MIRHPTTQVPFEVYLQYQHLSYNALYQDTMSKYCGLPMEEAFYIVHPQKRKKRKKKKKNSRQVSSDTHDSEAIQTALGRIN